MKRFLLFSVLALLATFFAAGSAFATTYYIAANGSDSNNGTSKTTPWLHAPGMPSCTGTCASTTPRLATTSYFVVVIRGTGGIARPAPTSAAALGPGPGEEVQPVAS